MEFVYFTLVAVALYVASDRLLDVIEARLGRRLEHRSLIFFAILLVLAVTSFWAIRKILGA